MPGRLAMVVDVDGGFVADRHGAWPGAQAQVPVARRGVALKPVRVWRSYREALGNHRLPRRLRRVDVENEIGRRAGDFVVQGDGEAEADQFTPAILNGPSTGCLRIT